MCTHLNKTGATYYFRRQVPDDLVGFFRTARGNPRTEWKRSLGTKDREEAKRLLRPHVVETDALIDAARKTNALMCGPGAPEAAPSSDPVARMTREEFELWEQHQEDERAARAGEDRRWEEAQAYAAQLDPKSYAAMLIKDAQEEAGEYRGRYRRRKRRDQQRSSEADQPTAAADTLEISKLFERYAAIGAANPKTISKWRARVANLVEFLGHGDAARITRADLNRWIETLAAKGLSKKTVVDGYLPAVRVALSIAHDDGAISSNPASGLKVRAPKVAKLRERDLTDDEARTILQASLGQQPPKLAERHKLARRWVPWIMAYTGARVGEITQLRDGDIRQEDGVWIIHITPEAGSVKTYEARSVPLHSHLIEQGITELAKPGGTTPLFHDDAGNEVNPASKIRAADLAKWVRKLGIQAPQPNHGWRHRWKTQARAAGIIQRTFTGETGKWAHSDWMKVLAQFRTFSVTAVEKQWGRNVANYGAMKSFMYLMAAMSFAAPIHMARVGIRAASIEESKREAYLEDNLKPLAITRATLNYASLAGLSGDIMDLGVGTFSNYGGDMGEALGESYGVRGKRADQLLGGVVAPSAGLAQDAFEGAFTGNPHKLIRSLPGSNLPYVTPFITALREIGEEE